MADVRVEGPEVERSAEVLTPQALAFVADLQRHFGARRDELLAERPARHAELAAEGRAGLRPETAEIRDGDWRVPPPPAGLVDRRVEITGPTEPKMAVNALNCGANVWLADLEDATRRTTRSWTGASPRSTRPGWPPTPATARRCTPPGACPPTWTGRTPACSTTARFPTRWARPWL